MINKNKENEMSRKGGFPGGMPGGNMNNMLKQAQKMQKDMEKMQEELAAKEVEASVGGGAVVVKVTGAKSLVSIKINPDVVDSDDVEMLEDLILTAVNQALDAAEELSNSSMGKIAGGMGIPGLF